MIRLVLRCGAGMMLLAAALSVAVAQDRGKDVDLDEFRRLRRLETPMDFWNAIQFELDLGKPDIAARYLRGLINKKPSDKDMQAILDKDGITAIMKLRNIRVWTEDKKDNAQAIKDAESLIDLATEANKKRLADDARIRELIDQLQGTEEEKKYAIAELYKIGANAVPHFIEAYLKGTTAADRDTIVQALLKMGPSTVEPLLAALDADNTLLKHDILDVLRKRHAARSRAIVPWLYFLSASKNEPASVRQRATEVLALFLDLPASRLPSAKVALTREAERYFDHKVDLGDPRAITVWRWDGKKLVTGWPGVPTVTASQAEHYYGQRFARQALTLDPDYRPAQLVSLSLAVDKAMEKAGPAAPISRTSPETAELLAKASPELVIEMLDRAIKERRSNIVLAAVRTLGDRAEVRSRKPAKGSEPALVRALYYPDPRVQMAAAVALLNIPGTPTPKTAGRIVEVLARALSTSAAYQPGNKILVALADEGMRDRVRQSVVDAGAQPIVVRNGKDAMRQLRASAEIQAILLDSTLPYPGLANTLAQMRQDVDIGKIPILLAAVPETRASHDAVVRYRFLQARVEEINKGTSIYRALLAGLDKLQDEEKKEVEKEFAPEKRLSLDEKFAAYRRVEEKYAEKREQAARDFPAASTLLKEVPRLEKEMSQEVHRYDLESQVREAALARYIERCKYSNVKVIHTSLLTDAKGLETTVLGNIRDAGVALTAPEQREAAEQAMELLANLAEGKPNGYDVRPAADTILEALRAGRLSPEGQKAGIRAATLLDGAAPQKVLATVVQDGGRSVDLRVAAARALIVNLQRQGALLPAADVTTLAALARQEGVDPKLKDQLLNISGALRPSDRSTGERLRDFRPTPAPALPPPAEKDKGKAKDPG